MTSEVFAINIPIEYANKTATEYKIALVNEYYINLGQIFKPLYRGLSVQLNIRLESAFSQALKTYAQDNNIQLKDLTATLINNHFEGLKHGR